MAEKEMNIEFVYNDLTDVMFADLASIQPGEEVTVLEIGAEVGFPGQIQIRVNLKEEKIYGVTIQNFSGFKRTLQWQYRMLSARRAIQWFITTLLAGLRIDQNCCAQQHAALTI
jgi:hypothetical protein